MNISIPPEFESFIASKISSGAFHSSDEIITEGLRLLAARDDIAARNVFLNMDIQKGLDSLAEGKKINGQDTYQMLQHRLQNKADETGK